MTTTICPKALIFVNAIFALAAIGLTAYKAPASFIYKQTFFPENNMMHATHGYFCMVILHPNLPYKSECRQFIRDNLFSWRQTDRLVTIFVISIYKIFYLGAALI